MMLTRPVVETDRGIRGTIAAEVVRGPFCPGPPQKFGTATGKRDKSPPVRWLPVRKDKDGGVTPRAKGGARLGGELWAPEKKRKQTETPPKPGAGPTNGKGAQGRVSAEKPECPGGGGDFLFCTRGAPPPRGGGPRWLFGCFGGGKKDRKESSPLIRGQTSEEAGKAEGY